MSILNSFGWLSFKIRGISKLLVLINTFWIRLRFVKYRFVRYRFVRYWFRFVSRPCLDTDIPSKQFVYLQDIFKTSSRLVFKVSSRHAFKISLRHVFKTSSRRIYKTSWKMKNCYAEDVLKTSSRPTNICWVRKWLHLECLLSETSREVFNWKFSNVFSLAAANFTEKKTLPFFRRIFHYFGTVRHGCSWINIQDNKPRPR